LDPEALVTRVLDGDRQAFAGIVLGFERPLFGFLGRMGLDQARAEEVAQETFLRAWQHLGEYRAERAAFSTWLFTIARRLAVNELTRASSRHERPFDAATDVPVCGRPGPPDTLIEAEQIKSLRVALLTLPLPDRSVLALAYVRELDMEAIARIEHCKSGAVKTRLHRARQRLRQILEASDEQ
jgi:RNA polymerase sigma-70 factor (ECF subfamily)